MRSSGGEHFWACWAWVLRRFIGSRRSLNGHSCQTERLLGVWVFDYRYNFLPFDHLVAFPRVADQLCSMTGLRGAGICASCGRPVAAAGWRRASAEKRLAVALLWACVIGAAFLTQPASLWIWDRMPLLRYVQYPWRFLGPAAFCLALLAGASRADTY